MKIAFLNIYNGRVHRGSEVFVDRLATELQKNHQVTVFQTGRRTAAAYGIRHISGIGLVSHQGAYRRLPSVIAPYLYSFLVFLFTLKSLPWLWQQQYDWIIPVNGGSQVWLCRLIRFFRGGNILISGHAGIGADDRWNLLVGCPDVFVALTPAAYAWAKETGVSSRVLFIPNGVDTAVFSPQGKKETVPLSKPIILCAAALVSYKRINLLIDAVSQLPAVSLLLVGDGPLRQQLREQGSRLLGERFLHIPLVTHQEMPQYYRAANLFSLPSKKHEAFGLVYLEALACNLPVVAPDDENRRTLIGDAGTVCNVEDPTAYATALQRTLDTDYGDAPRKQAQQYSWERVVKHYEEAMTT